MHATTRRTVRARALAVPALALVPMLFGACASTGDAEEGLQQVEDFHAAVERLHVANEVGQTKVRACGEQLMRLLDGETQGEPRRAFTAFVRSLDECEEHSLVLRQELETVDEGSHPVFEKWREDLKAIVDPKLRHMSEARLQRSYDRYRDLLSASRSALTQLELFDQRARDVAVFLGNDLNPGAIEQLDDTADALVEMGAELDERLTTSLVAIQTYLQGAGDAEVQPENQLADEPETEGAEPFGPALPATPPSSR